MVVVRPEGAKISSSPVIKPIPVPSALRSSHMDRMRTSQSTSGTHIHMNLQA